MTLKQMKDRATVTELVLIEAIEAEVMDAAVEKAIDRLHEVVPDFIHELQNARTGSDVALIVEGVRIQLRKPAP